MSILLYILSSFNYANYLWERLQQYSTRVKDALMTDATVFVFPTNSSYAIPITKCLNRCEGEIAYFFDTEERHFRSSAQGPAKHASILSLEMQINGVEYDLSSFFESVRYHGAEPTVQQYISAWAATQQRVVVFDGTVRVEVIREDGSLESHVF
jgi:hypothetical protein